MHAADASRHQQLSGLGANASTLQAPPRVGVRAWGEDMAVSGVPMVQGMSSLGAGVGVRELGIGEIGLSRRAQGVDLNLDQFDVSEARHVGSVARAGSWAGLCTASAFFDCLDGPSAPLTDGDLELLRRVFNPALTDRRCEGDLFVPPETSYSYVLKLRGLVKTEEQVREQRKDHFFSGEFVIGEPGPLFPHSWTPSLEVARGRVPTGESRGALRARPEYVHQLAILFMLKVSVPVFDKATEEGLRFRIYRFGSLEVRTTQEHGGEEVVGAVFSVRTQVPSTDARASGIEDDERIARATQYVERDIDASAEAPSPCDHHYLLLETKEGGKILTERFSDGHLSWVDSPEDIDDRNSLAKLIRSGVAQGCISVKALKSFRAGLVHGVSHSSKSYAKAIFDRLVGSQRNGNCRLALDRDLTAGRPFRAEAKDVKTNIRAGRMAPPLDGPVVIALPGRHSHASCKSKTGRDGFPGRSVRRPPVAKAQMSPLWAG